MKKHISTLIVVLAANLFFSCFGEINSIETSAQLKQYPLKVGNNWQYDQEGKFMNIRPDSLLGLLPGPLRDDSILVSIPKKKTLLGTIGTYVIREEFYWGGSWELSGEQFYANQTDGLFLHAYKGLMTILPKNNYPLLRFKNNSYQGITEILREFDISWSYPANSTADTINMKIPPLLVLTYPLEVDQSWIYQKGGESIKIMKKVVSKEVISTSAGPFEAIVVQWFYDLNSSGNWDKDIVILDYYSSIGLVKRAITFKNMEFYNRYNQIMGYADYSEVSDLQKYSVQE